MLKVYFERLSLLLKLILALSMTDSVLVPAFVSVAMMPDLLTGVLLKLTLSFAPWACTKMAMHGGMAPLPKQNSVFVTPPSVISCST